MRVSRIILYSIIILLMGCASKNSKTINADIKTAKPANAGFLLLFTEIRPFESESSVRIIITDNYLRIDEGPASEDYILFNRQEKAIFNVVQEDQSILKIKPKLNNTQAPFPLRWVIESQTSQALMRSQVEKAAATHYLYHLNDKPCYNIVTINNQLVETLDAMREYHEVLANELKSNYSALQGQQCQEAMTIFDPNLRFQYGFPLREWSTYGYQRFLVDFQKDVIFPENLFTLPSSYKQMTL